MARARVAILEIKTEPFYNVAPMLSIKFQLNPTYCLGADNN